MIEKIRMLFGKENGKTSIVARNILAALVIKGFALIISLFTMPAYMSFFDDEQILGIWFTVLSIMTWILNFDLGIGNGLRNKLSMSIATGRQEDSKEYISSAYWLIGAIVLVLTTAGWFAIPLCDWNAILNISPDVLPVATLVEVVRIVFISMMLQFFLRLISSVLYALQKASLNNLITLVTSVSQLVFVWVAPSGTPVENLKMFAVGYLFCSNLPLVVATVMVFAGPLRYCIPRWSKVKRSKAKEVMALGGIFFLCQVLYMVIANTNEFFISNFTDPSNVVDYQVYFKLFSLGSTLVTLALSPMWSAISKAVAEKDFQWLNSSYSKLKKAAVLGVICEFAMIPFLQFIINIWLGEEAIEVNFAHAVAFASFAAAMLYQSVLSTFVCGIGRMKLQAVWYTIGVVLKVLIIVVGVGLTQSWIVVVLSNTVILVPYCVCEQISLNKYIKRNMNGG